MASVSFCLRTTVCLLLRCPVGGSAATTLVTSPSAFARRSPTSMRRLGGRVVRGAAALAKLPRARSSSSAHPSRQTRCTPAPKMECLEMPRRPRTLKPCGEGWHVVVWADIVVLCAAAAATGHSMLCSARAERGLPGWVFQRACSWDLPALPHHSAPAQLDTKQLACLQAVRKSDKCLCPFVQPWLASSGLQARDMQ